MPLDPEIQKAIAEAVASVFSEITKPLTDRLEKQQYDAKKLADAVTSLTTSIPQQLEERLADIKPSLDFINEVRKEYEAEQSKPLPAGDKPESEKIREAVLAEIKKEYEGKLTGLQSQLDERDKETKALREAERQFKMRSEVLNAMRAVGTVRPNTEEDLLTLLEKRGLLVEEGDRLFIKSVDKFGDPIKTEFKDILPKMLETDFAHFAVPRGGTGTDGSPGIRATPSQFNFEGMTAQDIYNQYGSNDQAQKALVSELEREYGKPN